MTSRHSAASARLPDFVEPMQAKLVDAIPPGNWLYEIKFDGYRALALRGGSETRILSRNQNDLGKKFPEIRDSIAALDVHDAIIDGEIVALDDKGRSSFQLLQAFGINQESPPIVFYAYDLLQLNGKDLRNLPVEKRKAKLDCRLHSSLMVASRKRRTEEHRLLSASFRRRKDFLKACSKASPSTSNVF